MLSKNHRQVDDCSIVLFQAETRVEYIKPSNKKLSKVTFTLKGQEFGQQQYNTEKNLNRNNTFQIHRKTVSSIVLRLQIFDNCTGQNYNMKRCGGQTEERIECKRAFEALKTHYAEVAGDDIDTIKRFEEFYHKRFGDLEENGKGDCHQNHHHHHEVPKVEEATCETKASKASPEYNGEIPEIFDQLKSGQYVLDLGSGHGFDAFLAEKKVGANGHVIGIDMTPAMIYRSRKNAVEKGLKNVEFRLGEIEHLPVEDSSIDVVISNKVIHGVPEKNKPQVFRDAFRVLKPNGRLFMADILSSIKLDSKTIHEAILIRCQMIINPTLVSNMQKYMEDAGFVDIKIRPKEDGKSFITQRSEGQGIEDFVVTSYIEARKP